MAGRDIVVTVSEEDWYALNTLRREYAGISVQAYVGWGIRVLGMQARTGHPAYGQLVNGAASG